MKNKNIKNIFSPSLRSSSSLAFFHSLLIAPANEHRLPHYSKKIFEEHFSAVFKLITRGIFLCCSVIYLFSLFKQSGKSSFALFCRMGKLFAVKIIFKRDLENF
jgi:uncharacterized protein (DUF486 family)